MYQKTLGLSYLQPIQKLKDFAIVYGLLPGKSKLVSSASGEL
jgi:hypothetical protein